MSSFLSITAFAPGTLAQDRLGAPPLSITAFEPGTWLELVQALLAQDGDVPGHPFHGNEYVDGISGPKVSIGAFCKGHLAAGKAHHEIAALAQKAYGSKTSKESVAWYASQMKKEQAAGGQKASPGAPKAAVAPKPAAAPKLSVTKAAPGPVDHTQNIATKAAELKAAKADLKAHAAMINKASAEHYSKFGYSSVTGYSSVVTPEKEASYAALQAHYAGLKPLKAAVTKAKTAHTKALTNAAKAGHVGSGPQPPAVKAAMTQAHAFQIEPHQIEHFGGKPIAEMTHAEKQGNIHKAVQSYEKAQKSAGYSSNPQQEKEKAEAAMFLMKCGAATPEIKAAYPKVAAQFGKYTASSIPPKDVTPSHPAAAFYNKTPGSTLDNPVVEHLTVRSAPLTAQEHKSMASYTGSGYSAINSVTRGKPGASVHDTTIQSHIAHIDAAIEKSSFGKETVVYRGMSRNSADRLFGKDGIESGMIVKDPGFASTSKSFEFAKNWKQHDTKGCVVLEIKAKAGQKGLDVEHISNSGVHEHEIMLPRGAEFKVLSVKLGTKVGEPHIVKVEYV